MNLLECYTTKGKKIKVFFIIFSESGQNKLSHLEIDGESAHIYKG